MKPEQKIVEVKDLSKIREKAKSEGKTIGLASGCYDLFQSGHAVFFSECKAIADIVVISVGSDSVVRKLKGPTRPITPEKDRAFIIAAMQDVDYVVLGTEAEQMLPGKIDFYETMKQLRPDFFILNVGDSGYDEKKVLCDQLGVELKLIPRNPPNMPKFLDPTSSTALIEKIKKL